MKCRQAKSALLLQQSGEIGGRAADALKKHLEVCATCREEERLLNALVETERNTDARADVGQAVIDRILARAEADLARTRPHGSRSSGLADFFELWRPALIYGTAALLLAILSFHLLRTGPAPTLVEAPFEQIAAERETALAWDPDLDDALDELEFLLAYTLHDDGVDTQANGVPSLDELAAELLELEGWNI